MVIGGMKMEYKIKIKETATLGDLSDLMAFFRRERSKKHKAQNTISRK